LGFIAIQVTLLGGFSYLITELPTLIIYQRSKIIQVQKGTI